jgi:hypothetical protein
VILKFVFVAFADIVASVAIAYIADIAVRATGAAFATAVTAASLMLYLFVDYTADNRHKSHADQNNYNYIKCAQTQAS